MAHFHSSGKIPVEMERLKIRQREFDIISEHSRKSLAEILRSNENYGAVSGSKIREHLFGTMLRHNDTTLWPVSMALRHSYTTFSLHNRIFWLHSWAVRRNDVTFRLYYMTFRRQSRRSVIMNCRTIVTRGKRVKNDTMFWLHFNPDICVRSDLIYLLFKTWPTAKT